MYEKIVITIFIIFLGFSCLRGCSEQSITRSWGGEMEVTLEPNEKLMEVTWKEDSLWLLTKEMDENDEEETYRFYEKDSLGMLEGCVTIKENKLTPDQLAKYEEQKRLAEDYYKEGNIDYQNEETYGKEIFIQYNVEDNTYTELKPYTYDEYDCLIEK